MYEFLGFTIGELQEIRLRPWPALSTLRQDQVPTLLLYSYCMGEHCGIYLQ